ncbi:DUF4145 domain-containing protein [Pseudidiomarina sp. 1APP75-32.1]|uniref:DUF4145 domain-containing protein n=1 Tax=Pseudidiomarina terrestris TaxID=2820060 RepID=A0AAW7R2V5_9GAMM|nr:DUF4145 domain-containing protein [Pseudidiomarina sp. 1APP75-32.1]MDN7125086.1 DUF4145 domain-containing protein [Pseudidiomarina sp. 1APP75-32.1]
MNEGTNWTCPHCENHVTITSTRSKSSHTLHTDNLYGQHTLYTEFTTCPNPQCKKFSLSAELWRSISIGSRAEKQRHVKTWHLVPSNIGKTFPDYIPKPIIDDYQEACEICHLSPKASATLARRCLQGIIRDFWKVKPDKLFKEINSIKDKVDGDTWDAIDSVRSIGNIGAHMENDINIIVDVEPNEAQLLIELIEFLLKDWYIQRHQKREKLAQIKLIAQQKKEAKTKD